MTDLEKFIIARWVYSLGGEYITNYEYTILENKIKATNPDSEYVNRSWSSDPCPSELLIKYNMSEYIKAVTLLDKTESIPSLGSFGEIEYTYRDKDITGSTLSFKHDGWNMQFDYYDGKLIWAQTRGRASNSKEAHALMSKVPDHIPVKGKVKIVGECTVPNALFPEVKDVYGNQYQRSAVSTLLASGGEAVKYLDVHMFDIHGEIDYNGSKFETLEAWGFKTPYWEYVNSYDELLQKIKDFSDRSSIYASPADGLVLAGTITRAMRVLAWEEPIYKSYISLDNPYVEKYGAHRISLEINVFPIRLVNSTQRVIAITNLQRILDNDLRPGYPIAFRLNSHAVADIDEESTRLLQEQWKDNLQGYRMMVESNEAIKEMML